MERKHPKVNIQIYAITMDEIWMRNDWRKKIFLYLYKIKKLIIEILEQFSALKAIQSHNSLTHTKWLTHSGY